MNAPGPRAAVHRHRRHHGPHRVFWRIYLHGLLLLVLVGIAIALVGWAMRGERAGRNFPQRMGAYIAQQQAPLLGDPAALQREVDRTAKALGLDLAIYGADGHTLLAASSSPPIARRDRGTVTTSIRDAQGAKVATLVARPPWRDPDLARPMAALGAVLVALALGSIPLARSLSSPIERLTAAVEAFGKGDLRVRSGIDRGDQIGNLARSFDEMAERIEGLIRNEKELLANVSHELRTPLSRIRIALELAEEGDPDAARRYLRDMGTDLAELESLIESVIAAARLDLASEGTPPLRLTRREIPQLIDTAADRFRSAHPDRSLVLEVAADLPALEVDEVLLRRALGNLLDNAAKYSDAEVILRARAVEGTVEIAVEDHGIGVAPEDQARLFTPFFRTDRSRARGTGGVGLGLLLSKRIVEAHGGSIVVESTLGRGTTFRIRLGGGHRADPWVTIGA